jgi:hypothetical protein
MFKNNPSLEIAQSNKTSLKFFLSRFFTLNNIVNILGHLHVSLTKEDDGAQMLHLFNMVRWIYCNFYNTCLHQNMDVYKLLVVMISFKLGELEYN